MQTERLKDFSSAWQVWTQLSPSCFFTPPDHVSAARTAHGCLCMCHRTGDISWLIDKGSQWPTCLEVPAADPPPSVAPVVQRHWAAIPVWTRSHHPAERTGEDTRGHQQTQRCYRTPQFCDHWTVLGTEDTKSPPPHPPLSLVTTTFWTWLLVKYLPYFMRHREGQRPFVQITMYNIVLCV